MSAVQLVLFGCGVEKYPTPAMSALICRLLVEEN